MHHKQTNGTATARPLKMYRLNELDQMDRDIAAARRLNDSDADDTTPPLTDAASHIMALAFAKVPAIGTSVIWRGQPYTLADVEPCTRKDGVASQVLTWEAPCWTCGEPFLETAALGGKKAVNRRCRKHKRSGSRVKGACHPPMRKPAMKKAA